MTQDTDHTQSEPREPIGWAILELMGHRRLGGYLTEEEIAGRGFLRITIPGENDETYAEQFYSPTAVYAITPTTEAMARAAARQARPEPITRWELSEGSRDTFDDSFVE